MRKLFSIIAAILFAGSMMAADATIAKGTTNSYDGWTINDKTAIKMGKSGAGGDMKITVGANAAKLKIHAVAWKGKGSQTVTITPPTGVTATPATFTPKANDAISGTATSFSVTPEADYEVEFMLTGVGSDGAELKLASTERTIVWEATYEAGEAPTVYKPTFEPKDEEFEGLVTITLACATEGASIYYTLDGTEPTEESLTVNPFTITKTTTVKAIAVKGADKSDVAEKTYTKLVFTQYEVAEAIATALTENDPLLICGVVTKIELTPKNFVKYGSVNVWVKDATGAEGEFEFFQCYSLEADTFKAATPEFDPTSATVFSATSVTDKAGNTLAVGDTVIGKGRYYLYESGSTKTYELQKNCNLTSIIHPEKPSEVTIEAKAATGLRWIDATTGSKWWQAYGETEEYGFSLSPKSTTVIAGDYDISVMDPEWTWVTDLATEDTIAFVSGSVTAAVDAEGVVTIKGTYVGEDGISYKFDLTWVEPTPATTANVNVAEGVLVDQYLEAAGLFGLYGTDAATNVFVQVFLWTAGDIAGDYTEEDFDTEYFGTGLKVGTKYEDIYTAELTITVDDNNKIEMKADLLGYNSVLYKTTLVVPGDTPSGINNAETAKKLVKAIENGTLMINVNGVKYNVNGAIVK